MTTIREQIIAAMVSRAAVVRSANGYRSELGSTVEQASSSVDKDDLPVTNIIPGVEDSTAKGGTVTNVMPVRIEGYQTVSAGENPSALSEAMLADLIEANTGNQWAMAFTEGAAEIAVGDTVTGDTSEVVGHVAAVTVSSGSWAGGDAAGTLTLRRVTGDFTTAETITVGGEDAATVGTVTASTASTVATGGLADRIEYRRGGTEEYPEPGQTVVGVMIEVSVHYKTRVGDPYHQPA